MELQHLTKGDLECLIISCIQVVIKKRIEALADKVEALTEAISKSNMAALPRHLSPENDWPEFVGMQDAIRILQWHFRRNAILKFVERGKITKSDKWPVPKYKTADLFELKRKHGI